MDAKDIELDLQALQRLYGLLNTDEQLTTTKEKVDEHARLLLKNLLDTETQRVFKAHSDIIAGQVREIDVNMDTIGIVCASGSKYKKKRCRVCQGSTLKQLMPVEGRNFNDDGIQNLKEVENLHNRQNNQFNHFLMDNEQETGPMMSCKVGNSLNIENERKIGIYDSRSSGVGSTDFLSRADEVCNSTTENSREFQEVDYLSREASEAIKQIELHISALQLGTELSQQKDYVRETKLRSPVLQTIDTVDPLTGLSQNRGSLVAGNDIQYKLASQTLKDPFDSPLHSMPVKTTNQLKEMELPNFMSGVPFDTVQGTDSMVGKSTSRIVRSRGHTMVSTEKLVKSNKELESLSIEGEQNAMCNRPTNRPTYFLSQAMKENPYQNQMAMKERISKRGTVQPCAPFTSLTDFGKSSRNTRSVVCGHKVNQPFPHKIMRLNSMDKPTKLLAPVCFHEYQTDLHHDGAPRHIMYMSPSRNIPSHQDVEGTPSSSHSSNRVSQQASTLGSESEERSMPVSNRRMRSLSSGSSSDGTSYFPSDGTESHYTSYTSNSEGKIYSSASSTGADLVTSNSSCNSEGNSSHDQPISRYGGPSYISMKSKKRRSSPKKIRKSARRINQRKQSGKWKRLKDRLAIIFHHHHHHHHYDDTDDHVDNRMRHSKSLQKNRGKRFWPRRENEAYGEQAVEKLGKSLTRDRPGKNQHKHFYGLMEGLLGHVLRSKKSKRAKDSFTQVGKGQHGGKKPSKKLYWWQLLQHNRGSKFPNKPHAKLGLNKKKARVRVLPTLK